jgi:hypothetical protein
MRKPGSMRALEELGRVRLSPNFFMRDFVHSEIASFYGVPNIPQDPDLAIAAGRQLCSTLLEPLQATFGRIAIRSAFRSREVTKFGNDRGFGASVRAMPAITSGTCATQEAAGARRPASSFPGLPTATPVAPTGARSPGGFMTISLTRTCSSTRSSLPTISCGARRVATGSRASSHRGDSSPGPACRTSPATTPKPIRDIPRWSGLNRVVPLDRHGLNVSSHLPASPETLIDYP